MSRPLRAFILCVAIIASLLPQLALAERVRRVIDGDTIELTSGERVRYIGIDTPETAHPQKPVEFMGKEASEYNCRLVEGKDVQLEYDVQRIDKYGRTLAYVFLDTLFVNAELVRLGFAQILTIPPNVKYVELFRRLQSQAREAGLGLWNPEAADRWESPKPSTEAGKFYITRTGQKYHRGGCRYLARSAIKIAEADAKSRGYEPCSVCIGRPATTTTPRATSSGRCRATTKKGTQCKRSTAVGSSYCWQHGG